MLFGGDPTSAPLEALEVVAREVPTTRGGPRRTSTTGIDLVSVLTRTGPGGLERRRPAHADPGRRVRANGRKVAGEDSVGAQDLLHGRFLLLRKGRSTYHLVAGKP